MSEQIEIVTMLEKLDEKDARIEALDHASAVLQAKYDQAKTDRDTAMVKHIQEYAELERQFAAEKALSADLARAVALYCPWEHSSLKNYMEKYPDWKTP